MKLMDMLPAGLPTPSSQFSLKMLERASARRSTDLVNRVTKSWDVADEWLPEVMNTILEASDAPGILGEAAHHQLGGAAKRLRARLALAVGHALHADMDAVVKVAAACELLHEASLVHDDLQDRDTMRRGRRTVWYAYSDELAITLGDWLINQAYDVILSTDTPARVTRWLARALAKAVADTVRGQAIENEHKSCLTTSTPDYIDMAAGKTAPLLSFPLEAVCFIAGRSSEECKAIRSALEGLGGAYQLRDDLIDLLGLKGRGDSSADLIEGKATLPVLIYYRDASPRERRELQAFLSGPRERREVEAAVWTTKILESNGFDEVRDLVEGLMDMGFQTLGGAPDEVAILCKRLFGKLIGPIERPVRADVSLLQSKVG